MAIEALITRTSLNLATKPALQGLKVLERLSRFETIAEEGSLIFSNFEIPPLSSQTERVYPE